MSLWRKVMITLAILNAFLAGGYIFMLLDSSGYALLGTKVLVVSTIIAVAGFVLIWTVPSKKREGKNHDH